MKFVFLESNKNSSIDNLFIQKDSVTLLGAESLPIVNLEDEYRGKSNYIKSLCLKSRNSDSIILVGGEIECKNKTYWGTFLFDHGKFLGISDCTHPIEEKYTKSSVLRVFESSIGRLGVISGDDLYYFEVSRLMTLWECDYLIFSIPYKVDRKLRVLAEAQAISNGVTAIIFGKDNFYPFFTKSTLKKDNGALIVTPKSDTSLVDKRRCEMYSELVRKKPY